MAAGLLVLVSVDVEAVYTARTRAKAADVRLNGVSTWDVENVEFKEVVGDPVVSSCFH